MFTKSELIYRIINERTQDARVVSKIHDKMMNYPDKMIIDILFDGGFIVEKIGTMFVFKF